MNINVEKILKFLFPEWQIIEIINEHGFVNQEKINALSSSSKILLSNSDNQTAVERKTEGFSNIVWEVAEFIEVEKIFSKEIIANATYVKALCEAFKRPYVSGYNELMPKNTIFILGDKSIGKVHSVKKIAEIMMKKRIIRDGNIKSVDLSKYSRITDESIFLSDLYQALYGSSDIIIFENYEKAHSNILNILSQLLEFGKYNLKNRYILQNNMLVECTR